MDSSGEGRHIWIVHPLLLAIYPVVALLGWNIEEIAPAQTLRSFVVVLVGAAVLLVVLRLLVHDGPKAALLVSLALLLFFSYGQIYTVLRTLPFAGPLVARHRYLIPIFVLMGVGGTWFIVTRRGDLKNATRILNWTAAAAVALAAVPIVISMTRGKGSWQGESFQPQGGLGQLQTGEPVARPDVYYIILDGYARSDYMYERFGFDNSSFLDFLLSRGFYVATQGNANHTWMALSLASSLNMDFDQDLGLNLAPGAYPSAMVGPIRHSLVRANFERLGYKIVGFSSGYEPTEITDADYYFSPDFDLVEPTSPGIHLNAFEGLLFQTSVGAIVEDMANLEILNRLGFRVSHPFSVLRTIIEYDFDQLKAVPDISEPTFTFVHILAPHSPYIFGARGETIEQTGIFSLGYEGVTKSRSEDNLYRNQAIYITQRTQDVVQAILDKSETPPIIIIQADSGPSVGWSGDLEAPNLAMRTAIFNAYYLPDGCQQLLYPTISPVNSFRVVFDCYFGASYTMLPDNVYYSPWPGSSAYEFDLVNDRTRPPTQLP
jgi:hypothetical protein